MKKRVTLKEAAQALQQSGQEFVQLLQHGTMKVEWYAPKEKDKQYPHLQDELYLVAAGSGTFFNNGIRHPFQAGDVLFVPAGHEHHFEDFTPDFATWVIFYGPNGGESVI
jgi:mannose-6-phosphate isomerase-like protein (cupin superfamily)